MKLIDRCFLTAGIFCLMAALALMMMAMFERTTLTVAFVPISLWMFLALLRLLIYVWQKG